MTSSVFLISKYSYFIFNPSRRNPRRREKIKLNFYLQLSEMHETERFNIDYIYQKFWWIHFYASLINEKHCLAFLLIFYTFLFGKI